ncbi:hypothetical protein OCU04_009478 [Sclerotinia nivalis]|uniref:Uncharacterized protein n=1 Tax=Sclerotinia nivalis TaxID=352851 RepID=A0A9X0AF45_9HELO|nr:hypothetical protein OCU04_009478 [Sclerotinia nivalis]
MNWTVGTITTFTCGHHYFANLVWEGLEGGTKEERRCVAGPNTTWIKLNTECPGCQGNDLDHDQVVISQPPSPLLDAPDNLDDRRGTVTEFRCGHQIFFTRHEGELPVFRMDKPGFLLVQSPDNCPSCPNGEQFEDEFEGFEEDFTSALSQSPTFPTESSIVTRLSQRQDDESPSMRTSQPCQRCGLSIERSVDTRLDPDQGMNLETARDREQQHEMIHMPLSPVFDLPKGKESKREKAKAIGKSIWVSIKRKV